MTALTCETCERLRLDLLVASERIAMASEVLGKAAQRNGCGELRPEFERLAKLIRETVFEVRS